MNKKVVVFFIKKVAQCDLNHKNTHKSVISLIRGIAFENLSMHRVIV